MHWLVIEITQLELITGDSATGGIGLGNAMH